MSKDRGVSLIEEPGEFQSKKGIITKILDVRRGEPSKEALYILETHSESFDSGLQSSTLLRIRGELSSEGLLNEDGLLHPEFSYLVDEVKSLEEIDLDNTVEKPDYSSMSSWNLDPSSEIELADQFAKGIENIDSSMFRASRLSQKMDYSSSKIGRYFNHLKRDMGAEDLGYFSGGSYIWRSDEILEFLYADILYNPDF